MQNGDDDFNPFPEPVEIEITDIFDLHTIPPREVKPVVEEYLREAHRKGFPVVRIIHGKGSRSGARGPILKMAVNLWLRRHMDVMAFASARAIDGGAGALYVLLRA